MGEIWIQTYSGKAVTPMMLTEGQVCVEDIARSLSMMCRFNGHVRDFYSVAQHSVLVSNKVPIQLAAAALLHDAAEAYIGDITAPLKGITMLGGVDAKHIDESILMTIFGAFSVPWPNKDQWDIVRTADLRMLMTEKRDLLNPEPTPWDITEEPYPEPIYAISPVPAESSFLYRFNQLIGGAS